MIGHMVMAIGLLLLPGWVTAQQEMTLYFSRNVLHSKLTNPSHQTDYKFTFALPSGMYNYGNSAYAYRDLVKLRSDGGAYMDMDAVFDQLQDDNLIQIQTGVTLFSAAYQYKNWYFSYMGSTKFDLKMEYPKEFAALLWYGNGRFIGESIAIAPAVNYSFYKELSFGAAYNFERWRVGAHLKLLNGIANLKTSNNEITIYTDEEIYQSTLTTDYKVQLSNLDEVGPSNVLSPLRDLRNRGMGIDLGATFRKSEKLEFSASILDLGYIRWDQNVRTLTSSGEVTFNGLDLNSFVTDGEFELDHYADSVTSVYFDEELGGEYTSYLVAKTYLSSVYHLNDQTQLGALVYMEFFNGVKPAFSVYGGRKFSKYLELGLSYSIKNRSFKNVGLNLVAGPKAFRVFLITDNILDIARPLYAQSFTVRTGILINIGFNDDVKASRAEAE